MCYCSNVGGTDTEIRASTANGPWRRTFSHRFSWNLNQRPFDHKCGALTTELYLLHAAACTAWLHSVESIINTFPALSWLGLFAYGNAKGKLLEKSDLKRRLLSYQGCHCKSVMSDSFTLCWHFSTLSFFQVCLLVYVH